MQQLCGNCGILTEKVRTNVPIAPVCEITMKTLSAYSVCRISVGFPRMLCNSNTNLVRTEAGIKRWPRTTTASTDGGCINRVGNVAVMRGFLFVAVALAVICAASAAKDPKACEGVCAVW